jgi:hypothetical protein
MQEILIVRSDIASAQLLRRNTDGSWPPVPMDSPALDLQSIDFHVELKAIYAGTWLADDAA